MGRSDYRSLYGKEAFETLCQLNYREGINTYQTAEYDNIVFYNNKLKVNKNTKILQINK